MDRRRLVITGIRAGGALFLGSTLMLAYNAASDLLSHTGTKAVLAPLRVDTTTTQTTAGGASLWAGDSADIILAVTNPNPAGVTVTSITNVGLTAAKGTDASCAAFVHVASPLVVAGGLPVINGHNNKASLKLVKAITLDSQAPATCQGATFTATWQVTGVQASN